IVRGTTLRQSIIKILDRLHPRKIVIVSSAPQVRYPDYYGIDMSRMAEFIAFKAAVSLINRRGMTDLLSTVYDEAVAQLNRPAHERVNVVKKIYEPFTTEELSTEIARMLTPADTVAEVEIVYQSIEGLHDAIPGHPGDWYFTGDYPTPGGVRQVLKAYINFYEGNAEAR
ncbi:MAG: amidophosphoribosyltransferase, partial [Muribaculaceae bacterium]|nr:amidophosphoribosyltransferase [Muribaculaceae bacterium]